MLHRTATTAGATEGGMFMPRLSEHPEDTWTTWTALTSGDRSNRLKVAYDATHERRKHSGDGLGAYRQGVPRSPRDWLEPDNRRDFGTQRPVRWLRGETIQERGARAAAQEQFDVCYLVRQLMDRNRRSRAEVAAAIGLSTTQFNQVLRGESALGADRRCALGIELDFPASLELDVDAYLRGHRSAAPAAAPVAPEGPSG